MKYVLSSGLSVHLTVPEGDTSNWLRVDREKSRHTNECLLTTSRPKYSVTMKRRYGTEAESYASEKSTCITIESVN